MAQPGGLRTGRFWAAIRHVGIARIEYFPAGHFLGARGQCLLQALLDGFEMRIHEAVTACVFKGSLTIRIWPTGKDLNAVIVPSGTTECGSSHPSAAITQRVDQKRESRGRLTAARIVEMVA